MIGIDLFVFIGNSNMIKSPPAPPTLTSAIINKQDDRELKKTGKILNKFVKNL